MILNVLALFLVNSFIGALALIGVAVNVNQSGGCALPYYIGVGICFFISLFSLWIFIPAYRKQKKREEWDDQSKGI
jgi:Na+/proline symporter